MGLIVFRSSAGSGKTYTLVREYLRLILLKPLWFRHILAITFTNKAAQEMKQRLLDYLYGLASVEDHPDKKMISLMEWLSGHCQIPLSEIPVKARASLSLILHQYNALAISTIDSFMHQVVRSFAHDMGIPAGFDVELDESLICTLAVDNLLERAGHEPELTKLMVNYIRHRVADDDVPRLEKDLNTFARILLKEESRQKRVFLDGYKHSQYQELSELLRKRKSAFESQITSLASLAMSMITKAGFGADDFYQTNRGIFSWFNHYTKGEYEHTVNSHVRNTLENGSWASAMRIKAGVSVEFQHLSLELEKIAKQILELFAYHGTRYFDDLLIEPKLLRLALIGEIRHEMQQLLMEHGKMPISDFNSLVHEKVMGESVPYIYERLGQRYHHFMIDEFQDTSVLQWRNLLPLVENGLSEGYDSILVGDGKQSIYRWRNGEVEQFAALPKIYLKEDDPSLDRREKTLMDHYSQRMLDYNYRSSRQVIEFNNAFFGHAASLLDPGLKTIYDMHEQTPANPEYQGRVEVHFMPVAEPSAVQRAFEFQKIYEIVIKEQEQGGSLKGIAVLCRRNRDAREVSRYLLQQGIGVVSQESIQLGTAPSVRAVIACMRFLSNPLSRFHRLTLLEALSSSGVIEGELSDLTSKAGFYEEQEQSDFQILLRESGLDLNTKTWLKLPLIDIAEGLVRSLGMQHSADVHLQFMLDLVESFVRKDGNDMLGFLRWWDEIGSEKSAVIPDGMNAVKVSTIHKSKGLQFPVVICPFLSEVSDSKKPTGFWVKLDRSAYAGLPVAYVELSSNASARSSWKALYEKEEARKLMDHYNTYYVAFTRPKDRLYILCKDAKPVDGKTKTKSQTSVSALLRQFVRSNQMFKGDEWHRVSGVEQVDAVEMQPDTLIGSPPFTLFSTNWRDRLAVRRQITESWRLGEDERPVSFGELVHKVLAGTKTREDLDSVIINAIPEGANQKELRDKLLALMHHPQVEPLFTPGKEVKSEVAILMPNGKTLRPDRILFEENRTLVVDFKTGKPLPSHYNQINEYMQVLTQMGYPGVGGLIAYIGDPPNIVELN